MLLFTWASDTDLVSRLVSGGHGQDKAVMPCPGYGPSSHTREEKPKVNGLGWKPLNHERQKPWGHNWSQGQDWPQGHGWPWGCGRLWDLMSPGDTVELWGQLGTFLALEMLLAMGTWGALGRD